MTDREVAVTAATEPRTDSGTTDSGKWWALAVVCIATFMLLVDVTIVIVALPEIQHGLGSSFADAQWVLDAYALTLAALLLTSGSLADLFGRRRVFLLGMLIFTTASLACGLAQSPLMLTLCRAVQGVGGSMLFATSLAILAQNFHGKERGTAFGIWGAVTGVASGLGPILGGLLTTGIDWRAIFLVNVPVGVVAIIVTVRKVAESRLPHAQRPDWLGFVVFTAGLTSLVYGLIRAGETAWGDTGVIICLILAGAFLVGFLVVEARVAHPMFDLSLLRVPTFNGGLICAFCMNGSLFALFVYIVLYLQNDLGYSALGAGLRMLLTSGMSLFFSFIAGRLSTHVPVRWLIGPGLVCVGVGLLLMTGIEATSSWTHLTAGLLIAGVGVGLVNPPLASTAVGVVRPERSGMAAGINTTFRQIGLAVGIAVYGSIFTSALARGLRDALAPTPALAHAAPHITSQIKQGNVHQAFASLPSNQRGQLADAIHSSFASALNDLLLVGGILALVGAVAAATLIRSRDFVASHAEADGEEMPVAEPAPASGATRA
jgi:EmrB/QacA subfamily drug resistance transporter